MSQSNGEAVGRVPMSRMLAATMDRAVRYAREQYHRRITLEHLLLALTEDQDATLVLQACSVDVVRLATDAAGHVSLLDDRFQVDEVGEPRPDQNLLRIIEYASAAAQQSKRREINGAIVLAAIVGEGKSVAAGMLRAQGLTFEAAIRALPKVAQAAQAQAAQVSRTQPAAPLESTKPPPQSAEEILATVRERIQAGRPGLTPPQPEMPPPQPAAPRPAPPVAGSEDAQLVPTADATAGEPATVSDTASPGWQPPSRHEPAWPEQPISVQDPRPAPAPVPSVPPPPPPTYTPPPTAPTAPPAPRPAVYDRVEPSMRPAAAPLATAPPLPSPVPQPPQYDPVEPTFRSQPAPVQPPAYPPREPAATPAQDRTGRPPPMPYPAQVPQRVTETTRTMPPHPAASPAPQAWPESGYSQGYPTQRPTAPPPQGTGSDQGHATGGRGAPHGQPPSYGPGQGHGQGYGQGYGPGPGPGSPQGHGYGGNHGSGQPPPQSYQQHPPQPATGPSGYPPPERGQGAYPPPVPMPAAPRPGTGGPLDAGQLVENIPRTMTVGRSETVEVRIAKAELRELGIGLEGRGAPVRHDLIVTKAMSVRLRAPDGGFFIETASPETQWIENRLGIMSDYYAAWRWTVTPQRRGTSRLQLVVAARTVGTDGLAAESVLPEQVITVKVAADYRALGRKWGGWAAAAVVGGILARFGEGIFGTVLALM